MSLEEEVLDWAKTKSNFSWSEVREAFSSPTNDALNDVLKRLVRYSQLWEFRDVSTYKTVRRYVIPSPKEKRMPRLIVHRHPEISIDLGVKGADSNYYYLTIEGRSIGSLNYKTHRAAKKQLCPGSISF